MEPTVWVAIAGIVGTLLAAILSPLVTELMRRGSTRREQITDRSIDAYADLLRVTARLADNAVTWTINPLADLKETDDEDLNQLISRVRVVGGKEVRAGLDELWTVTHRFNSLLGDARGYHQYIQDIQDEPRKLHDQVAIEHRTALGDQASKMVAAHKQIEAAIRKELRT